MTNKIILASQSPRRRELINLIPIEHEVIVRDVEEIMDYSKTPEINVMELARQKAEAVATHHPKRWVLGSDTVVVCDGQIMGKPKNEEDAYKMLRALSGKGHEVLTGVHIRCDSQDKQYSFAEKTTVYFKELTDDEIQYYIKTLEPMDKAGAYGIQGYGAIFIEKITGDYYNVMGLPVHRVYMKLKEIGLIK